MTGVRDFVAGLARAGKHFVEIKKTVEDAYGDKALKRTQIYEIISKVKAGKNTSDRRHLNSKKTKRTQENIDAVAAAVLEDARVNVRDIVSALGLAKTTAQEWFFHRVNLTVHTAAGLVLPPTPSSDSHTLHICLIWPPANSFLFKKVKDELSGLSLNQESLKKA
jgi:hypothetical protein